MYYFRESLNHIDHNPSHRIQITVLFFSIVSLLFHIGIFLNCCLQDAASALERDEVIFERSNLMTAWTGQLNGVQGNLATIS
jgi:hypothetical protein